MSNSVITSYVDASGGGPKAGKQLVVLVNKDGTLSLEKEQLHSLLDKESLENVSISLVHVNEDGKPKYADEESVFDEGVYKHVPHVNLTVNAFYDPTANDSKNDDHDIICTEARDLFLLSFQNDHCYTRHTLPDEEHISSRSDVEVSVIDTKPIIPSSKKITVLENKLIPKGKKLINLGTSVDGQIILKRSDILKKIAEAQGAHTCIISSVKGPIITGTQDKNTVIISDASTTHPSNAKDTLIEYKKPSTSFQNEYIKNISRNAEANLVINENVKSLLTKKIESRNVPSSTGVQDVEEVIKPSKPVNIRNYGRDNNVKLVANKKKSGMIASKEFVLSHSNESVSTQGTGRLSKADINKPNSKVFLKKKAPSTHMNALLDDMTSLFSTPDVLRRVSTDTKKVSEAGGEGTRYKSEMRTYSNSKTSIQSKRERDPKNTIHVSELPPSNKQSLLQQNITHLPPIHTEDTTLQNTSANMLNPSANINPPLSPSLDILGGIQEEGLSEDFLMHVAQLVESSEKLQEVIDTQVLGKVDDIQTKEMVDLVQNPLIETQSDKQPGASGPVTRKEPIQIVRSNGRVITLPPIEAPATRSSKRKSLLNATLDQPVTPVTHHLLSTPTPPPIVISAVLTQTPTSSKSAVHKKTNKSERIPLGNAPLEIEDEENIESDESWNSEDDPDRLWCICKQPHNNRFMICCDMCEDWFHGKCVNITKAMGQDMEEKGIEWRCPSCVKKRNLAKVPFKPTATRKSVDSKSEGHFDSEAYSHLPVTSGRTAVQSNSGISTNCIVCKKTARPNSIYCSDNCILKHAQESLNFTSQPSGAKHGTPGSRVKDDVRVIVYERKTGKCLAGPSAPTAANLKTWLRENPTFEVVRPGAMASNKQNLNVSRPKTNAQKVQSVLKIGNDKQIILGQPSKNQSHNLLTSKVAQPPVRQPSVSSQAIKSPTPKVSDVKIHTTELSPKLQLKITTPKQVTKTYVKTPPTPKTPTQQKIQPPMKSPSTPVAPKKEENKSKSSGTEPIRENVRKTLKEQLSIRMAETKNVHFSTEEISKFAVNTEHELHDLFKDVGVKYKAKYRSLMFNLKDRKNLSLWQKICDKSITPKQLVRLSPEELASQELAQWRDQEAKHQLELIKKSELDLLACNKSYVLKTHKGEEVMEDKSLPTAELDPNVTLDDIVSALNHTKQEETKDVDGNDKRKNEEEKSRGSSSPSPSRHRKHSHHSSHYKHSRRRSRSRSKSSRSKRDHSTDKHKSSSKDDSLKDSKSSSRSHHRKSSDDKSKIRSNRHSRASRKSSHSDSQHRSSSHSRSKDKNEFDKKSSERLTCKRSSSKSRRSPSKDQEKSSKRRSSSKETDGKHHKSGDSNEKHPSHTKHSHSNEMLDIDEKLMLKAAEDTDILLPPVENVDVASPPSPGAPQISSDGGKCLEGESDQEPTSTVDSAQYTLWSGGVTMVDVVKYNVIMCEVSGACNHIVKDLRSELQVVGRIQPQTVWEYVDKMKKQAGKEIIVTKILPANEKESSHHTIFFNYLNSRNRLAVVKNQGPCMKDFYIFPLAQHAPIPSALLPMSGPGLDEFRSNMLLGVIVGQKRKRSSTNPTAIPSKMTRLKDKEERSYTPPTGTYTPPSSPKHSQPSYPLLPSLSSSVKHQIAASLASAEDEPYSPGDSDSVSRSPSDLHKKMEELDRKIEERKKQIQSIAENITSGEGLDEPYSPSRPMSPESSNKQSIPGLSDISLPSNLQEILATIHQKTAGTTEPTKSAQEAYIPTAINVDITRATASIFFKEGSKGDVDMRVIGPSYSQAHSTIPFPPSNRGTSKLASLSEAELLSMVPDSEVFPPLPPTPVHTTSVPPPPYKKMRLDPEQPPPPGLEDEH